MNNEVFNTEAGLNIEELEVRQELSVAIADALEAAEKGGNVEVRRCSDNEVSVPVTGMPSIEG